MKKHLIVTTSVLALTFAGQAFANSSDIDQIGATNLATVDQQGGNNGTSVIEQIGANHDADVTQSDDGGSNSSDIFQDGALAVATVNQNATVGPVNTSEITQRNSGVVPGTADPSETEARVSQNGNDNFSSVEQGREAVPLDRTGQFADIMQTDESQTSTVIQKGNNSSAIVTQSNSGNTSEILQTGGTNSANVLQSGMTNTSTVSQSANFGTVDVQQLGDGNTSEVEQSARANNSIAAIILQDGHSNFSKVTQTSIGCTPGPCPGHGNQLATVTQTSDFNSSTIEQDGGDPVVDTVNPGNEATVLQAAANGSMSWITQSGAGNTSNVKQ